VDHAVDYCCARREELSGLIECVVQRAPVLYSDGLFHVPPKTLVAGLIFEYRRTGEVMRDAVEEPFRGG
jgi:hypothetical protein